jgi:type II secretion system protein H
MSGYTLLELTVVLAIISLIAASLPIAMSRMLPGRRVNVTAERLIADVRWLQTQSSVTSAPARLSIFPSSYRLQTREGDAREVSLAASTTLSFCALGDEICKAELVIYPDGTSSAGRFEIADSGRRAVVEVSMLTGRVRRVN